MTPEPPRGGENLKAQLSQPFQLMSLCLHQGLAGFLKLNLGLYALVMSRSLSSRFSPSFFRNPLLFFLNCVGEQGRRQIPGGAGPHHDFPQVQHPEVLPGRRHHPLCSPRRHGRQRLLRPLCENVSTHGDPHIPQIEMNRSGMLTTGARLPLHRRQIEK